MDPERLCRRVQPHQNACGYAAECELAEAVGVSRQSINAIETAKCDPSLPPAYKIVRMFSKVIEETFLYPEESPAGAKMEKT
jgi:putative transcriptional regulator